MLRREALSPRRGRQLARNLGTWSIGVAVVGAAIADAALCPHEPRRATANVEVDEPPAADPEASARLDDYLLASGSAPAVAWLAADAPRPPNRIALDGLVYRLQHRPGQAGMAIELAAPPGCVSPRTVLDDTRLELPARGVFPDGTYELWTECAGAAPIWTRLHVEPR